MEFKYKIDPHLKAMVITASSALVPCVVYLHNALEYRRFFNLFKYRNINILYKYPFINAFGVNLDSVTMEMLASEKGIRYITRQTKVAAQLNVAREIINVNVLHKKGFTGKDIGVAIIDTGIFTHLDFVMPANRIKVFKDFLNSQTETYDDNGHGTAVAGILAGNGLMSNKKYMGIAPDANLIVLKALDKNGETGAFTILEAMQWIYENAKKYNIKVVCMSFGSAPLGVRDPLAVGAEALWRSGITVVAAAGNSGPSSGSIKSPGTNPRIITVGALDDGRGKEEHFDRQKFKVADFSSRGPAFMHYKPDIIAPGVNIMTATNKISAGNYYNLMSGTSMATPIVAGVACLLASMDEKLTPDEVKALISRSGKQIVYDRNAEGLGILDTINIPPLEQWRLQK